MIEIKEIISQVKLKEKEGDKELKSYLFELDINTLNRLLVFFKEISQPRTITKLDVFQAAFTAILLIGALLFYVIVWPTELAIIGSYVATFVSIVSLLVLLKIAYFENQETQIIKNSQKLMDTQKIITIIYFVLQKKYIEI